MVGLLALYEYRETAQLASSLSFIELPRSDLMFSSKKLQKQNGLSGDEKANILNSLKVLAKVLKFDRFAWKNCLLTRCLRRCVDINHPTHPPYVTFICNVSNSKLKRKYCLSALRFSSSLREKKTVEEIFLNRLNDIKNEVNYHMKNQNLDSQWVRNKESELQEIIHEIMQVKASGSVLCNPNQLLADCEYIQRQLEKIPHDRQSHKPSTAKEQGEITKYFEEEILTKNQIIEAKNREIFEKNDKIQRMKGKVRDYARLLNDFKNSTLNIEPYKEKITHLEKALQKECDSRLSESIQSSQLRFTDKKSDTSDLHVNRHTHYDSEPAPLSEKYHKLEVKHEQAKDKIKSLELAIEELQSPKSSQEFALISQNSDETMKNTIELARENEKFRFINRELLNDSNTLKTEILKLSEQLEKSMKLLSRQDEVLFKLRSQSDVPQLYMQLDHKKKKLRDLQLKNNELTYELKEVNLKYEQDIQKLASERDAATKTLQDTTTKENQDLLTLEDELVLVEQEINSLKAQKQQLEFNEANYIKQIQTLHHELSKYREKVFNYKNSVLHPDYTPKPTNDKSHKIGSLADWGVSAEKDAKCAARTALVAVTDIRNMISSHRRNIKSS